MRRVSGRWRRRVSGAASCRKRRRAGSRWGWLIVAARQSRARRVLSPAWPSVMPVRKLCRSWCHPASRCFSAAVRNGFCRRVWRGAMARASAETGGTWCRKRRRRVTVWFTREKKCSPCRTMPGRCLEFLLGKTPLTMKRKKCWPRKASSLTTRRRRLWRR